MLRTTDSEGRPLMITPGSVRRMNAPPVMLRYTSPDDGLLFDDHVLVLRDYKPLEVFDDKGGFWTCAAVRVTDGTREYVAPRSRFEYLAADVFARCACDACYAGRALARNS